MGQRRDYKTVALFDINAHIADVADRSPSDEPMWEFFCECGDASCHERLALTLAQYAAVRDTGGSILAFDHEVNQSARAERLIEEARALKAQAEQQLSRAWRARRE